MNNFDIHPFSLPNTPKGEIRFEEPRDISKIAIVFAGKAPRSIKVFYLCKTWLQVRIEQISDLDNPCAFGWTRKDWRFPSKVLPRNFPIGRITMSYSAEHSV
jgi:hypothetical protein